MQYSPSIPRADGGKTPPSQQTPAKASKTGNGGGTTPAHPGTEGSKGPEESGEGESSPDEGAVVGGSDDGKPQGNAGGSANGEAKQAAPSSGPPSHSSDGGGSSPLVPILIAIALLAAISVAVVMFRQRRQQDGSATPASPKAS